MGRVIIDSDIDFRPAAGDIAIEISSRRDNRFIYGPLKIPLRARWVFAHHRNVGAHESYTAIQGSDVPEIPGNALVLNIKNRTLTVLDLLHDTKDGRRIWETIDKILDRFREFYPAQRPGNPIYYRDLDDNAIKDHLYYMRRMWDAKYAALMEGSDAFPSADEIRAMPGGRIDDHFSNIFRKPEDRYVDVVRPKGDVRLNPRNQREDSKQGAAAT